MFQRCAKDCPPIGCKRGHKWAYDIELPADATGKRKRRTKGGYPTGKDALDARDAVLTEYRNGLLPQDGKITVATWLRDWLVNQEEVRGLRDGTVVDYRRHVESYWIPAIGHLKLTDLHPQHVTNTLRTIRADRDKAIKAAKELRARYAEEAAIADEKRKAAGRKRPVKPKKVVSSGRSARPPPYGFTRPCDRRSTRRCERRKSHATSPPSPSCPGKPVAG
ncbi:hypothetical protein HCA58_06080 [Micromonospora sp. HNM0581]|uniref:Arm DNA-binding domain-containing protein n=1 Tax=Micromonospora sp. HNM0581 TaxID=2716341 RepID=UPI00146C5129|nr:hypothetical protein [Micromonospora sp. HNM0581]